MEAKYEWKKRCPPVKAEPAFQPYCAQCAVFPLPQPHCLHLDSLKLKMATWSAVRRHTESLEPVISFTTSWYRSTTSFKVMVVNDSPMCIILTKTFDIGNGPTKIFSKKKKKANFAQIPRSR